MPLNDTASGQGIERFSAILRALATHQAEGGGRLTDIALATGLSKSTVHRLLGNLVEQGLVEQDAGSNLFYLSFEMFALGAAAANRFGLLELAHGHLLELERRCSDTVFVSIRSGAEAICIDRVEGSFPIKVLTLNVGDRRPLGVGAGSLALLAALADDEIAETLETNRVALARYSNFDSVRLWTAVRSAREQGYSFNPGLLIPEMCALGVPVLNSERQPLAALSIAATVGRMEPGRRTMLAEWLQTEAKALALKLERFKSGNTAAAGGKDKRARTR
jgi:DNA-binding IclR family transcriptional regulator